MPEPLPRNTPAARFTTAQLTSGGRCLQAKKAQITAADVFDVPAESGGYQVRTIAGLYVHVPFCFHKCHYCDFYSIVDSRDRQVQFVDRLAAEIRACQRFLAEPLTTVFVGGGTPTLLDPESWKRILAEFHANLRLSPDAEFTVEANPETVTPELAQVLVSGGVNRISVGCQSFNPRHLKTLERWHDPQNVHRSVEILRSAGISNLNLDLIFAIPGQTLDEWMQDLDEVTALHPTHLSCYSLIFEPNTPLTIKMKQGQIAPLDQDLEAAMYEATIDRLAAEGFEHYEISSWSRIVDADQRQFRCAHNLLYWRNANWWPLGPSAAGHVNGVRWKNIARLGEYLDHGPLPPIVDLEHLDDDGAVGEELMLGLRMIDGIEAPRLEQMLNRGTRGDQRRAAIERFTQAGLLMQDARSMRLTRRGLLLADSVIAALL